MMGRGDEAPKHRYVHLHISLTKKFKQPQKDEEQICH